MCKQNEIYCHTYMHIQRQTCEKFLSLPAGTLSFFYRKKNIRLSMSIIIILIMIHKYLVIMKAFHISYDCSFHIYFSLIIIN